MHRLTHIIITAKHFFSFLNQLHNIIIYTSFLSKPATNHALSESMKTYTNLFYSLSLSIFIEAVASLQIFLA